MRRWTITLCLLAITTLTTTPVQSEEKGASRTLPQSVDAARVADHDSMLRLDVGSFLVLVFPPKTFSENTAVTANLDLERRRLQISTRGGEVTRHRAQIRIALQELEDGLEIIYDHRTDDETWFEGTFVEQADEPMPQIVARTSSGLEPVVVGDRTSFLLSENNKRAQRVRSTALAYGDLVRVRYERGRRAQTVEASRVTGDAVVDRVESGRLALVGAKNPLVVSRHARCEESDGNPCELESLRPKDRIALRINPQNREVWHITRLSPAPVDRPQLVVTHNSAGPLRPGDWVQITGTGTPGGTLTIDILNVENDLRADELIGQPGTYQLTYTVPRGIELEDTPIIARLDLPDGQSHTVLSESPLVFAAAISGAADPGAIANGERPKTPVVTSPEDQGKVENTINVSGFASPYQKVRVIVDFAIVRSIVMLGEGRLTDTELTADARGYFATGDISTEVKRIFGGDTHFKITVTSVSRDGVESDPAIVYVQRPD